MYHSLFRLIFLVSLVSCGSNNPLNYFALNKEDSLIKLPSYQDLDGDSQNDPWRITCGETGAASVRVTFSASKKAIDLTLSETCKMLEHYIFEIAKKGQYSGACIKGYFDCDAKRPSSFTVSYGGLLLEKPESHKSIIYFDPSSGELTRHWLSD